MRKVAVLFLVGALTALILYPVSLGVNTPLNNNVPRADGGFPMPPFPPPPQIADGGFPMPPFPPPPQVA